MHYGPYAFYDTDNGDGQPTIAGKFPFLDPAPQSHPTLTDAQKVCGLYHETCHTVCGDGIFSPLEECDDGNNENGDACTANCKVTPEPPKNGAVCGNGIVEPGEDCDDGPANGQPTSSCSSSCKFVTTPPIGSGSCLIDTCDPRPGHNKCDISTSCIPVGNGPGPQRHLCACRHGFRVDVLEVGDTGYQTRIPKEKWPSQEGRVFVFPGQQCNKLCDAWTLGDSKCLEVGESAGCF